MAQELFTTTRPGSAVSADQPQLKELNGFKSAPFASHRPGASALSSAIPSYQAIGDLEHILKTFKSFSHLPESRRVGQGAAGVAAYAADFVSRVGDVDLGHLRQVHMVKKPAVNESDIKPKSTWNTSRPRFGTDVEMEERFGEDTWKARNKPHLHQGLNQTLKSRICSTRKRSASLSLKDSNI